MEPATHPRSFAAITPDKPALVMAETGETLSYSELARRSAMAANLFAARGIAEGDVVAFQLENSICYPELVWAAKDIGLRYVTVSSHLNAADTAYILADSGAQLFVASPRVLDRAKAAVQSLPQRPVTLALGAGAGGFESYDAALAGQPDTPLAGRRRGSSMLYSSGTTGRPKGIRTELADVTPDVPPSRFAMLQQQYGFDARTVFLNPAPFYHSGPLRFMMTVHRCGGTVVGFQDFNAAGVLRSIEDYGVTHGFMVPTMFSRMLKLDEATRRATDHSSLRHIIHAAAPCPVDVKRAMIDWWGPVIDELYSGTEAIGHTFIGSDEWLRHPGSVGRPAANCRLKIVDDGGRTVPPGTPGRIMMANGLKVAFHDGGAGVSLRDAEGYASLGDVGYVDHDGYLYLTDRESHMIIAGGVNIYPQEAEAVLLTHPAVEDVAVIGVPHEDMGEEVKAVVQLAWGGTGGHALEREIIDFCLARLSAIKCPRSVDFVERLPRNALGKMVKHELRARYWQGKGRVI